MSSSATYIGATRLRVLSWNIAGGPSGTKLEWLRSKEWDVAILLEVSTRGAGRLLAATDFVTRCVGQYRPRSSRRGRRMMVAFCARPGVELGDAYPPIDFAAVESFEDQCMAVDATSQGIPFTVVGFHAPNAAVRGQSSKELLFERLAGWLKGNDRDVFLGADMNCWATGVGPGNPDPKPHLWHQERFRAQDETHPLVDSYRKLAESRPELAEPTACWTYATGRNDTGRMVRMDQLFVPASAVVVGAGIDHTARGPDHSDHAAVWADVALPAADG